LGADNIGITLLILDREIDNITIKIKKYNNIGEGAE
jgi:hypothetical protein